MTAPPSFVHLHLHSELSLADGLIRIKPLMRAIAGSEAFRTATPDAADSALSQAQSKNRATDDGAGRSNPS